MSEFPLSFILPPFSFSLKSLSAVKVACCILEASQCSGSNDDIEVVAMGRVKGSGLPLCLQEMLGDLIKPVNDELRQWYQVSRSVISPVWSPQGTVDTVESAKAILEDKSKHNCLRFMLACNIYSRKHVLQICEELADNEVEQLRAQGSHFGFCYDLCNPDGRVVQQLEPTELYRSALCQGNEFTIRYIIETWPCETVRAIIGDTFDDYAYEWHLFHISPAAYLLLYSKLCSFEQIYLSGVFSAMLLTALLKWPYQPFFQPVAQSMIPNLYSKQYFDVLLSIAARACSGYRDYDYRALYVDFWEMGDVQRIKLGDVPISTWPLELSNLHNLMDEDESIIHFVLCELPVKVKTALLLDFTRNRFCDQLLSSKNFQHLELFVRDCGMHSEAVLVKFKYAFVSVCPEDNWKARHFLSNYSHWEKNDWDDVLVQFEEMMDRIIAEKRSTTATAQ